MRGGLFAAKSIKLRILFGFYGRDGRNAAVLTTMKMKCKGTKLAERTGRFGSGGAPQYEGVRQIGNIQKNAHSGGKQRFCEYFGGFAA